MQNESYPWTCIVMVIVSQREQEVTARKYDRYPIRQPMRISDYLFRQDR
jgi:hypothetical protein